MRWPGCTNVFPLQRLSVARPHEQRLPAVLRFRRVAVRYLGLVLGYGDEILECLQRASLHVVVPAANPACRRLINEQLSRSAEVKSDGTGGINYSHYGTAMPGIDTLLEQALDEPDFAKRIQLCERIELQVLRDLPLIGVSSLSYVIARNPRVDVGYPVRSGYARWRLTRATIVG